MAAGHDDPFHHVRDFPYFEVPSFLGGEIHLPSLLGFQLTKFMVLQVVAGLLVLWIFKGLAKQIQSGEPPRGAWWNFWETLALFVRDQVVRPTIGEGHEGHDDEHHHAPHSPADAMADKLLDEHDDFAAVGPAHAHHHHAGHPADKYLPYVWTCFFYVLFCNLLGAVPWLGSATAEINVTGVLALVTFGMVVLAGSKELGAVGFWKALVPSMDLPGPLKIVLIPMIWAIEFVGLLIKHGVLAVRLFANIMAGHTVIAVILGFIAAAAHSWLWYAVAPASVMGQVAIGMLELFVAFLQAYIFAFLATLFIGMAVHPH